MFAGKTVIVTGSSSGIGAQAAIEFVKQGANVVLHGRNQETLAQVEQDCSSLAKNDRINNAGMNKTTPIVDGEGHFDMETFDQIMNVNFRSVVQLTMKCLPHLKASKGSIVNVSSIASSKPFKSMLAYCISKTAIDGFTRALAAESASYGVRVNAINPGPIPTAINRDIKEQSKIRSDGDDFTWVPMQRQGSTMETANAILFLASEHSSYSTGNVLFVDGGLCTHALLM